MLNEKYLQEDFKRSCSNPKLFEAYTARPFLPFSFIRDHVTTKLLKIETC